MDTSVKYAEMCDCLKIQDMWKPAWGDFQYGREDGVTHACLSVINATKYKDELIWLPRQDQLQEKLDYTTADAFIVDLYQEVKELCDYYSLFKSMEQITLAMVMRLLHNKTWNGEVWIGDIA